MLQETGIGGPGGRAFPTTRWTLILSSHAGAEPRRAALSELVAVYWKPLYFYARRKGLNVEAAKDAVQGLFAHLLERDDFLERLDPEKGSFRAYLRRALDNHLANVHEARSAQKRGGGARTVSLDFDVAENELAGSHEEPVAAYDREWALCVFERALGRLEREFREGTRQGPFEVVRRFFQPGEQPTYVTAAADCGMSVPRFKAFLHRARVRFRALLELEVGDTLGPGGGGGSGEIEHLLQTLS